MAGRPARTIAALRLPRGPLPTPTCMSQAKCIGRYPVLRLVGQGAMGSVYEGFHPGTGEKVAIKVLRAEHLEDGSADSARARFEREALATQRLRHPNIVTVHEYREQGRIRFIAMEFLHGGELRQLMRERGPFARERTLGGVVPGAVAEPVPLVTLAPGLPAAADTLLRRALAPRCEERFQQAAEFAHEVAQLAARPVGNLDVGLDLALPSAPDAAGGAAGSAVDIALEAPGPAGPR
jgi:hypothetical protein